MATGPQANDRRASALLLPLPEIEHLVSRWRSRYTEDGRSGMPAHITLLYPFFAPAELSERLLADVRTACAQLERIWFDLHTFDRFPGDVLWLAPSPGQPLVWMIERLAARYAECPPYEGAFPEIVPHATVAESRDSALLDRIAAAVEPSLPVRVDTVDAWLMHRADDRWAVRARLPFAPRS